jgi:hypothetical protein
MFIEKVTSFSQKKLFLFFAIFLFFLKTKNSNFDNQQLKIINKQINHKTIMIVF